MKKVDNQGAALVTVIVIVSFVSILATIALYMSGMNFTMKTTDIKTKDSFYEAETALEEVKAYLILTSSKAFEEAYVKSMNEYGKSLDGNARATLFKTNFFDSLQANWRNNLMDLTDTRSSCQTLLNNIVDLPYNGSISVTGTGDLDLSHEDEGYAVLNGICLSYTKDDFTTEIQTDFMIKMPVVNWEADQSNKDWQAGDTSDDLKNETIDFADYVQYLNWVKK